jgi:hypothetical protein
MRNGPVTSELLDLINAGRLFGEADQLEVISSPSQVVLRKVIAAAHTAAGMPPAAKKLLAQI